MTMKMRFGFAVSIVLLSIFACQEGNKETEAVEIIEEDTTNLVDEGLQEKTSRIKNIFYSLPSPLELTMLFKNEGVEYHKDKLHEVSKQEEYVTTIKKALNLGVYGADLSYAGLFGQRDDAIRYFSASQSLAADLGISQTFQQAYISRLESNANNRDTLLQVISDFFLENDAYLKEYNQQNISTYVLLGGWIEGLYLGTHMLSKETNSEGIREIIIGQKSSLSDLNALIDEAVNSHELTKLLNNLDLLRQHYGEIVQRKNDEMNDVNSEEEGLVLANDQEISVMQDSTFNKIKVLVTDIRSSIIR